MKSDMMALTKEKNRFVNRLVKKKAMVMKPSSQEKKHMGKMMPGIRGRKY
jgi:hypothetical protein